MTENDFTYRPQDVNYLGFLEAQLRDMQGIATLAYELIQNADDARGDNGRSPATTLSFNITDDALIVENDGVFRPVDFNRLQNLAGGGKRDEADTTGAFGLGFIAVYQVTDAPEIFSNNIHWVIRPDAPADRRIIERSVPTTGTCFVLPWAFDERSDVRRALRIAAVVPDQLDMFAAHFAQAIEVAALFLTRLHTLTVLRNGRLRKQITHRQTPDDQIVLTDEAGQTQKWLLLQGDFAADAAWLRGQYAWQIESKRRNEVRLALPLKGLDRPGRLFAMLPTNSTTPLPFHINADFYPTTDRKRIHFDNGYQAEWNRAAIRCAARILARRFAALPQLLDPVGLWQLLQQMTAAHHLAGAGDLPETFASFWQAVAPILRTQPIFYTVNETWTLPKDGRLLVRGGGETAVSLLKQLNIPVAHPDLTPYATLMQQPEIGTPCLTIQDITDGLRHYGMMQPQPLSEAPLFLRSVEALQSLWHLIDALLNRIFHPRETEMALDLLHSCALVLTDRMTLDRLDRVYYGKPDAQALFPEVHWVHTAVSTTTFPGRYLQSFGVRQAVDLLAETPIDRLEEAWRMGRLDLPALFRWFESQQIEIFADDPALQQAIRRLPLVLVNGELRPLADLYLPGGFDDPLRLAGLVDVDALGGRPQFLHDLGVRELEFTTYVHSQLPRALAYHSDLPSDARHHLLDLLAERLGEIRDDEALQAQLARLPLIATMDGAFRPADEVYASRDVLALLGDTVHVAEPVESGAVLALHRWLGVRTQPTATDIVQRLVQISRQWGNDQTPLDDRMQDVVTQCLHRLDQMLVAEAGVETAVAPLKSLPVIPNAQQILMRPDCLFVADRIDLARRFEGLDVYLVETAVFGERITAVLGVQTLSQVVQSEIILSDDVAEDTALQALIVERRPLIERVLNADPIGGVVDETLPDRLRVCKVASLHTEYRLRHGDTVMTTPPEAVAAKWAADSCILFVQDVTPLPWTAIAREVTVMLRKGQPGGALAIGIREVLVAETAVVANTLLDELGYP